MTFVYSKFHIHISLLLLYGIAAASVEFSTTTDLVRKTRADFKNLLRANQDSRDYIDLSGEKAIGDWMAGSEYNHQVHSNRAQLQNRKPLGPMDYGTITVSNYKQSAAIPDQGEQQPFCGGEPDSYESYQLYACISFTGDGTSMQYQAYRRPNLAMVLSVLEYSDSQCANLISINQNVVNENQCLTGIESTNRKISFGRPTLPTDWVSLSFYSETGYCLNPFWENGWEMSPPLVLSYRTGSCFTRRSRGNVPAGAASGGAAVVQSSEQHFCNAAATKASGDFYSVKRFSSSDCNADSGYQIAATASSPDDFCSLTEFEGIIGHVKVQCGSPQSGNYSSIWPPGPLPYTDYTIPLEASHKFLPLRLQKVNFPGDCGLLHAVSAELQLVEYGGEMVWASNFVVLIKDNLDPSDEFASAAYLQIGGDGSHDGTLGRPFNDGQRWDWRSTLNPNYIKDTFYFAYPLDISLYRAYFGFGYDGYSDNLRSLYYANFTGSLTFHCTASPTMLPIAYPTISPVPTAVPLTPPTIPRPYQMHKVRDGYTLTTMKVFTKNNCVLNNPGQGDVLVCREVAN